MEPMKTADNVLSGIITCLSLALIASVVFAIAGCMFVAWIDLIMYGQMHVFFKAVILLFPMISISLVIVYLLDLLATALGKNTRGRGTKC